MVTKKKRQPLNFESLTPDHIADIAYAFYVTTLDKADSGEIGKLAKIIVNDFKRLNRGLEVGSKEYDFMSRMNSIVLGLSRGIMRGKTTYAEEFEAAKEEKDEKMGEMSEGTRQKVLTRGLIRAMLVGGIGFSLVRAIFPSLNISSDADPTYFSLTLGFALVLISTIIQDTLVKNKVGRIFAAYEMEKNHAYTRYRSELRVEYLRAKAGAQQGWIEYFGTEPLDLPSFEMILDEEARLNGIFEQRRVELSIGTLRKFFGELRPIRVVRSAIKRARSGNNEKGGSE